MGSDEWVVIGGKGRPRRTPQQQAEHLKAKAAAAEALAAVGASPPQHSPVQQHAAHQQLEALAAAMAASPPTNSQPLPGWGPPPGRDWKVACSSKTKKKKGRLQLPSTPEEQVQQLSQQVQEISTQLRQTPMYAALVAAMQQAAAGAGQAGSSSSQTNVAQQLQQPGPQQQQQQQQGSHHSFAGWDWAQVQQLVVYGLGSVEDSKVSRHQLALVLLLQQLLPGLQQPPQLYDPAFSDIDRQLLQQIGMSVIGVNEEGRRQVRSPTLFYLPHCEGVLCDNLLDANWCCAGIGQLAILGNSFATYQERWGSLTCSRPTTRRPDKLLQLVEQGAVVELPVPDHNFHVASAFNDMSLHTFRPTKAALGQA